VEIELTELLWLDQHYELSLAELAQLSGLAPGDVQALLDLGAIIPLDASATDLRFAADSLPKARAAHRLRRDFELDMESLALVLHLRERIDALERQLVALRVLLPRGAQ